MADGTDTSEALKFLQSEAGILWSGGCSRGDRL